MGEQPKQFEQRSLFQELVHSAVLFHSSMIKSSPNLVPNYDDLSKYLKLPFREEEI